MGTALQSGRVAGGVERHNAAEPRESPDRTPYDGRQVPKAKLVYALKIGIQTRVPCIWTGCRPFDSLVRDIEGGSRRLRKLQI